jgi:endoglucanase
MRLSLPSSVVGLLPLLVGCRPSFGLDPNAPGPGATLPGDRQLGWSVEIPGTPDLGTGDDDSGAEADSGGNVDSGAPDTPSTPLGDLNFWIDPNSAAAQQASAWRSSNPDDAAQMDKIAGQPVAKWLGDWNTDVAGTTAAAMSVAEAANAVPIFVVYNIPQRDCGGYSSGGGDATSYRAWVDGVASGIGGGTAVVVLEPDSLALITCLSDSQLQERYDLLKYATASLKAAGDVRVYLDGGNSAWIPAGDMAARLTAAGVADADGFAVNVSNFHTTDETLAYADQIASGANGAHFVIDTSRNGLGATSDNQWCNPPGRALGNPVTTQTGDPLADAFLWVKTPGESDGSCNGGPAAGGWWPDYALGLAQRASW